MNRRPRITEESVLTRWMGLEIARMNDAVVAGRKSLGALFAEETPGAVTRGGGEHRFDREILAGFAGRLPEEFRSSLNLPILFFLDLDVRDSCYLTEEAAVRALQLLGDLGEGRRLAGGRLWVSRAIAYAIAQRYPTLVQFVLA